MKKSQIGNLPNHLIWLLKPILPKATSTCFFLLIYFKRHLSQYRSKSKGLIKNKKSNLIDKWTFAIGVATEVPYQMIGLV